MKTRKPFINICKGTTCKKKNKNFKLKQHIGRNVIEDEFQHKCHEKKKLKKDIKALII